jgi:hypothetical protein
MHEWDDGFDEGSREERFQEQLTDTRPTVLLIHLALATDDPFSYVELLHTLQIRGTREVLEAAQVLCGSTKVDERKLGVNILGRLGNHAWPLRLARNWRASGDEARQGRVAEMMARLGPGAEEVRTFPKEALATLLPMLDREEDTETLRDLLCAVAEYLDFHPTIVDHIAALRTHSSPHVRFTVCTRLGLDPESDVAQAALMELSHDLDQNVRTMAQQSLEMSRLYRDR